MERSSQQSAADLAANFARNRAELIYGEEISEPKIQTYNCSHEEVSVKDWDFGVDQQTGYRDCGMEVTCRDCEEVFTGEEYAALCKPVASAPVRKSVAVDVIQVEKRAVA